MRNSDWHGARKGMSQGACKTRETEGDKRKILNEGEILWRNFPLGKRG